MYKFSITNHALKMMEQVTCSDVKPFSLWCASVYVNLCGRVFTDISGKTLLPWPDLSSQMRLPRGTLGWRGFVVIVAILVNRHTVLELFLPPQSTSFPARALCTTESQQSVWLTFFRLFSLQTWRQCLISCCSLTKDWTV